jgi:hypothetical protein
VSAPIPATVPLVTAGAIVALIAPRTLAAAWTQLWVPFDVDLEVPTVNTILLLRRGVDVYARETFDALPFNLLMYTPAYHWLVAALPWPGDASPFTVPRVVSAVAMLLAAGTLFWVPATRAGWPLAAAAAVFFLGVPAVTSYIAYARQDSMALALSLTAMLVLSRRTSRAAIVTSAALAALAVLTKQSYVSAAIAGAFYLWQVRRDKGLTFVVAFVAIGGVAAVGAQLAWGVDFWWSVLIAPGHSFAWDQYRYLTVEMGIQWTWVALVVGGLAVWAFSTTRLHREARDRVTPVAVYVPVTFLVLALTLGKRGAGLNYFFEPTLALLAYLVERADGVSRSPRRVGMALALLAVLTLCLFDHLRIPAELYTFVSPAKRVETERILRQLKRTWRPSTGRPSASSSRPT